MLKEAQCKNICSPKELDGKNTLQGAQNTPGMESIAAVATATQLFDNYVEHEPAVPALSWE